MNERNYSAKYHLELCMKEDLDYSVGKSHLRLASLYNDYEQLSADVGYFFFSQFHFFLNIEKNMAKGAMNCSVVSKPSSFLLFPIFLNDLKIFSIFCFLFFITFFWWQF